MIYKNVLIKKLILLINNIVNKKLGYTEPSTLGQFLYKPDRYNTDRRSLMRREIQHFKKGNIWDESDV